MSLLGFHTIHFSPLFGGAVPALDVIRLTAEAGFDAIGLDLASVQAHGSATAVGAAIEDGGLACSDVLVLLAGVDDDMPGTARSLGRLAAATGAPWCIAAVAAPVPRSALVAALDVCADVLIDHGCRLAIEFTPYSALPSLAGARELCEDVGWDRCGLVLDPVHFFRSGAPWGDLTPLSAEQIAVVQWDDAPVDAPPTHELADESRHRRLLPGAGGLPLVELATAIAATGWDGVVSAEVLSRELRETDPARAIAATFDAMSSAAAGWRSPPTEPAG